MEEFKLVGDLPLDLPVLLYTKNLSFTGSDSAALLPILYKCPHLSLLKLDTSHIGTELADCIATTCQQFHALQLGALEGINNGALMHIAQGCGDINFLSATDCSCEVLEGVAEMASALPKLEKLVLFSSTLDASVELAAIKSTSLSLVHIRGFELSIQDFQDFTSGCPNIKNLLLEVSLTDGLECVLFRNCRNLRSLGMIGLESEETRSAVCFSANIACPLLEELILA